MSALDRVEMKNRLQLLRKLEKVGTDEAIPLTLQRLNELSDFLGKIIRKEIQRNA